MKDIDGREGVYQWTLMRGSRPIVVHRDANEMERTFRAAPKP
jgi:hypothetical protein